MPALLALAALLGLWRATVYVRDRTCVGRHHLPVRHPQGFYRCSRCARTEVFVGAFLNLDTEQEFVDPNRIHRDHSA